MSDPAILEAATRALRDKVGSATFAGRQSLLPLSLDDIAEAVLAAVTPLIRAQVLEEATKAMDRDDWSTWEEVVAAVTRALKSAAPAPSADSA